MPDRLKHVDSRDLFVELTYRQRLGVKRSLSDFSEETLLEALKMKGALFPKAVYGSDNRYDAPRDDTDPYWRSQQSVAILTKGHKPGAEGSLSLPVSRFEDVFPPCPGEAGPRWSRQPVMRSDIGTAFLVSPDCLVTTGHQVDVIGSFEDVYAVFDYNVHTLPAKWGPFVADAASVYKVKGGGARGPKGEDWAILELERPASRYIPPRSQKKVEIGQPVTMIGHPRGLPAKVAPNAKILSTSDATFAADLDAYRGNSGSPVFNQHHEVVGMLIAEHLDVKVGPVGNFTCASFTVCELCFGEVCVRIAKLPI